MIGSEGLMAATMMPVVPDVMPVDEWVDGDGGRWQVYRAHVPDLDRACAWEVDADGRAPAAIFGDADVLWEARGQGRQPVTFEVEGRVFAAHGADALDAEVCVRGFAAWSLGRLFTVAYKYEDGDGSSPWEYDVAVPFFRVGPDGRPHRGEVMAGW